MPKIVDGFWSQGPQDYKDYAFDFTEWLNENSPDDTIISAVCTSNDPTLTVGVPILSTTAVVIYVSGGVAGRTYTVECHMTTLATRRETASIKILIKDPI